MTGTGNTALAVREPAGALAIQDGQVAWEPMQLAALAQLGIKDAPDGDKQVFLHVSQRTGLDPFARQIYMIPRTEKKREQVNGRWEDVYATKWTIQTGIEGWRVIRDRAERRYGVRGIKSRFTYYAPDGSEHKVWVRREPPVAVEMTYTVVEASGREVPYTSVLRFSEYVQTKTIKQDGQDVTVAVAQWATKPTHMIEKCVEADAYRCAFPQDYSGVVLDDAMPPAPDWDSMSDEELDARARAVGWKPRVTGEQARARAPQRVPSEVVAAAPDEDVASPGSWAAKAEDGGRRMAEHAAEGQLIEQAKADGDPRADILAKIDQLGVHGADVAAYLTRITGKPAATPDTLNAKQAAWVAERLAPLTSRDELEAWAVARETAAEASDAQ